jgi:PDZ domain-containing protein
VIDLEGNIGPIGGVADKVIAAQSVDADILLIPQGNLEDLRGVDTGDVRLIAVSTLDEALAALDPSLAGA